MQVTNLFTHLHLTKPVHNFTFNYLYLGCRLLSLFIPFQTVVLCRVQSIWWSVCVLWRGPCVVLCCTEHRLSVHKRMKCVCFWRGPCVVQSTDYLCTNGWSVCVSGEGLVLYRAQNICAQTDEVCVFCGEGLVLCCTEHRLSVHKLMKCVCFWRGPCVVQSTEYMCTNWWSVCVLWRGPCVVLYRAQNICAQTDEVCVFLERALWKCVCFWRGPCGSVCISGEGLVEVCVFLERALWKCVCFWRGPWGSVCVSGEGLVEVCVFLERALGKCVCFWREPCGSVCVSGEGLGEVCVFLERALWKRVCFWRGPCGSVCVSGESLVEVCVFLERALGKCVCFWRGPCGSVCVSGEGLVEVCVFLERALWKCVCFWRGPCGSVCVFLERALWKCVCVSGESLVLCRFAFQYNPALQPRAIIVFGCISKTVTDSEVKQLLKIMMKVSVMSVSTCLWLEVIHTCTGQPHYNTVHQDGQGALHAGIWS